MITTFQAEIKTYSITTPRIKKSLFKLDNSVGCPSLSTLIQTVNVTLKRGIFNVVVNVILACVLLGYNIKRLNLENMKKNNRIITNNIAE